MQKIKDLQLDKSSLVNKIASAAVETFENITKGQVEHEIETQGIFECSARKIPLLNHTPNPYIAWYDDVPF